MICKRKLGILILNEVETPHVPNISEFSSYTESGNHLKKTIAVFVKDETNEMKIDIRSQWKMPTVSLKLSKVTLVAIYNQYTLLAYSRSRQKTIS